MCAIIYFYDELDFDNKSQDHTWTIGDTSSDTPKSDGNQFAGQSHQLGVSRTERNDEQMRRWSLEHGGRSERLLELPTSQVKVSHLPQAVGGHGRFRTR